MSVIGTKRKEINRALYLKGGPCGIVGESIGREAGYLACRGFRL